MKNFLKQHGLWVLFAGAVIAVTLALMSYFSTTSSPLVNLASIVSAPFKSAYTSLVSWIDDKKAYYEDYTALEEENKQLKQQLAEMEQQVRKAQDALDENERLSKLLNLREKYRTFELETATIIEHSSSNWASSLTLNRGTEHGVEVNDCVITESYYLVGIVSEVGQNSCTVLTVVDTDTSLGAQVFRTKDVGVASGDFSLMGSGKLKLSYLPAQTQLLNGDLVVTSGLGEYYPSGLVIGTVDEVQMDDSGATRYAVVEPSAPLDELTEVFIVKSFDIVD